MKPVPPFLRTAHNYDTNAAGDESGLKCLDKTRTKQSFKEECDINYLVDRYAVTGELPQLTLPPLAGDLPEGFTMQDALNQVVKAREAFQALPAAARARFQHDPVQFVEFCSDEANRDEMRKMGLWSPEAVKRFELEAQTAKDLAELNRRDAEEHRANKKLTPKGVN